MNKVSFGMYLSGINTYLFVRIKTYKNERFYKLGRTFRIRTN